ncbi:MAG: DUF4340 domain-containing protein [bacterium]
MQENQKTLIYLGVAAVLAIIAFFVAPTRITSDVFGDQGEIFYPDFTDPNIATTLEVVQFDESSATTVPFKVTFTNGVWTIPSHHNYPADGKERLAKTAAGLIGIKKDDFRTDNVAMHESFHLVDPLDDAAGIEGRGTRVTVKGAGDEILADYIIGDQVEGRQGIRFVRTPGSSRVYAARMDLDLSTRFEDWIETDLLETAVHRIEKVVLKDYSIDERTLSLKNRDQLTLTKDDKDEWRADKMGSGKTCDSTTLHQLLNTIDSLTIVGVRPKPAGLSAALQRAEGGESISQSDAISLQSKGFYFSRDGRLLSNEGELEIYTKDGVLYTLRFGEVVYGTGKAVTSGLTADDSAGQDGPAENRYLFISAALEPSLLPEPPKPTDTSFVGKADSLLSEADKANREKQRRHDTWKRSLENGTQKVTQLNGRFAEWYYVISAESYDKLHVTRQELVVDKS